MVRFGFSTLTVLAFGAALLPAGAQAATCVGVSFGANFSGSYSCNSLGAPDGVPTNFGGLTFIDSDTILIGGAANGPAGTFYTIDVLRDAGNHIIDFTGPSAVYAEGAYNDGGVTFGPGGVLFAARWPVNEIAQYLPGSTTPDKITSAAPIPSSISALGFVPTGFAGAGKLKAVSYGGGAWTEIGLTPDGNGTFDLDIATPYLTLQGGPEGFVYVSGSNAGFGGDDSLLLSEYAAGMIAAYDLDANGDPIVASREVFMSGLSGAEGALIDPLTGDFLFSTFGGGNQVVVVSGFIAPPTAPVPEPATWALMLAGFAFAGHGLRRARRRTAVRFA